MERAAFEHKSAESIELSIESGVICSRTAFVTINDEEPKPIEGAVEARNLDFGSARSPVLVCSPMDMAFEVNAIAFRNIAILHLICLQPYRKVARMSPSTEQQAKGKGITITIETAVDTDADSTSHWSNLSALIFLQTAKGYWKLDQNLAEVLQRKLTTLQQTCPTNNTAWATILALTALEKTFGASKDEWELVAMKANKWLKQESVPMLKDVRHAAEKCLA